MRKMSLLMMGLSVSVLLSGPVQGAPPRIDAGVVKHGSDRGEFPEGPCSCCQKCSAAMKNVKPKENQPPATNGCQECCDRCGKEKKPTQEQFPPEIIEDSPRERAPRDR